MQSITIKGSQRESVGKSATKALRNAGKVPCVLYGGDKAVHFSAEAKAFKNLVYTSKSEADADKTIANTTDHNGMLTKYCE